MEILEKLKNRERLSYEDGLKLYELDLFTLGKFANKIREEINGKKVYFNVNRHINPTNLCADVCLFCAFSSHRKNEHAYTMSHEEIMNIVDDTVKRGTKEIHIVSAHNPNVTWQWYLDIFKMIKEKYPFLHVKAMTAAEVDFLRRKHGLSYEEILRTMVENGVDSMPGGGAEIFDEEVRKKVCNGKVKSDEWLEIHRIWHSMGKESNATMLFGHIEERCHRIDHILRIRAVQDEAIKNKKGGFNAFIPLVYQRNNNYLKIDKFLGSVEILKTMAISRLMLDNVAHIKAYWATSTINLAMVAQEFGCDDLDGTIEKESIQSSAGAASSHGTTMKDFIELIKTSGFIPVQRDSLYNEIEVY
ncbi:aminofutalosine synthase MqnE [Campylobacter geochelonis]|uniref:Aminodeoxyfutalosine synthase n=1 Tax=Campylobacter geochelonis TaxID=1780362 RepID=A0A128EHP4_9BACT|nr:aminofutalosine synthase MqnE [Campylobacter geochelonis]QKF71407.1 menaquinone biosynthesis protein, SCO4494 family [Campylobacter geochelonis]CZE48405.1 radical SAM domain protein [Campylobacter geochelonis]CZE50892.1 radical SAM domain protein [Campylobacter geochelonis]